MRIFVRRRKRQSLLFGRRAYQCSNHTADERAYRSGNRSADDCSCRATRYFFADVQTFVRSFV